ncbi:hypothetical protein [Nitrospira sp. Kam-Ns4a]
MKSARDARVGMSSPVLVVERDSVLGEMLGEVLRRAYGCVSIVGTLLEALARLGAGDVQAVVLDTDTVLAEEGEVNRARLRDWLRDCAAPPPFVLVSVRVPSDWSGRLLELPSRGFSAEWVRKPFRVEDLLSAVQRAVRKQDCPPSALRAVPRGQPLPLPR